MGAKTPQKPPIIEPGNEPMTPPPPPPKRRDIQITVVTDFPDAGRGEAIQLGPPGMLPVIRAN